MSTNPGSPGGDRSEILGDFQACTGIEDVGLALFHLEAADWNLMDAIHRVLPQDTQTLPSERVVLPAAAGSIAMSKQSFIAADVKPEPKPSSTNGFRAHGSRLAQVVPSSRHVPPVEVAPPRPVAMAMMVNPETPPGSNSDNEIEDVDLTDSFIDDNDDDFELSGPGNSSKRRPIQSLITDNVEDQLTGTMLFSESFVERYGHCHPMFFLGTLEAAVREACTCRAKDRKLLAIYLHHDQSVLSNIFCQQVLCSEGIVNVLINNFIVWGWDVTHDTNRSVFLKAANQSFGASGEGVIRSIGTGQYPLIVIVSRQRGSTEIRAVIPVSQLQSNMSASGASGIDEMMVRLLEAVEQYRSLQDVDIREEEERLIRDRTIQEQDFAYQESLRADMAKDEAKRAADAQKKREEDEKVAELARIETEKELLAKSLAPEPSADTKEKICTLRCRFPNGKVGSRKFLQSSKLELLYAYLLSEGFSKENYKILFSYPKKDLTELYKDTQLIGTVFSSQETLIVEER